MTAWCNHMDRSVTGLVKEILPEMLEELRCGRIRMLFPSEELQVSGWLQPRRGAKRGWSAEFFWLGEQTFIVRLHRIGRQRTSDITVSEQLQHRARGEPKRFRGDAAGTVGDWISGLTGARRAAGVLIASDAAALIEAAAFAFDPHWERLEYREGRGALAPSLRIWRDGLQRHFKGCYRPPCVGTFSPELLARLVWLRSGRIHLVQHPSGPYMDPAVTIGEPPSIQLFNTRNAVEILRLLSKLPPGACLLG